MFGLSLLGLCSMLAAGYTINRPVYKIVLDQKGYAQFLQYDVETPPLREFTFCTWIRIYDLVGDQSIFTYVANSNNRVIRLWLDSGGRHMKISINGRVTSSSPVEIVKDVWRHVCLSYQSDFGAWALYVDARLVSCEAAQSLYGYMLPGGGSVIIGYGTADNGAPNGFEGEIFGANMILMSTIERNYTAKNNPIHEQKPFIKNKIKGNNKNNYIVLSDLQTDEIHNNFEKTRLPPSAKITKSYIKFRTPHSYVENDVGIELTPSKVQSEDNNMSKEILDFSVTDKIHTTSKGQTKFWNVVNSSGNAVKFRPQQKTTSKAELSASGTRDLPMISEYEMPPPPSTLPYQNYFQQNFEMGKPSPPLSIYKINDNSRVPKKTFNLNKYTDEISDIETPPPLDKNTKVYGQWTSSKFAGSVLNYLKSINFRNKVQKKVPQTIPLIKISDTFPYASDFKVTKVRPPFQFQRRNLVEKRFEVNKRTPQINVQILENDLRSNIIKLHAQTEPKQVEVTNRGEAKKKDHRFYRNVDSQESIENLHEDIFKPRPFSVSGVNKNHKYSSETNSQNNNFMSILPFLKSLEYFVDDSVNTESEKVEKNKDMYTKSLSNGNKWHNVKSYSNDFTPRHINIESDGKSDLDKKIAAFNKKHPSVRLNFKHEYRKEIQDDDTHILKGRELAMEVSNMSSYNTDSISILKYNHGFMPSHGNRVKITDKLNTALPGNPKSRWNNKNVKIGNALNERDVIGVDDVQKKKSFIGGDETIPDINRYRSDLDKNGADDVPSSLGPRVCRDVELYDRVLYVKPDESIDMTHILSPVRVKNIGIEFIIQNYKKCSLADSSLENNEMLFIDWSKTPVRLFGGANPRTTTDLCGFF